MRKYNVAILGATGAVGTQILQVLEEQKFPIDKLKLLANTEDCGKTIQFQNKSITIESVDKKSFENLDIVFGAVSEEVSKIYASQITDCGAVFIDNSSAFRMDKNVPLVIPEINSCDIFKHHGIIANPNCSTIIALMAIYSINKLSKITSFVASTYQATSGAGAQGPNELRSQYESLLSEEKTSNKIFQWQIAENLIPKIGNITENLYTTEEMKMQNESRKILHSKNLKVSCTCVRVPVVRSHSISINLKTKDLIELGTIKKKIEKCKGCKLVDSPENEIYPMPINTSNQDLVFVGRIRKDLTDTNGITLWCSGDQLRKGAATNAVQIALKLIEKNEEKNI